MTCGASSPSGKKLETAIMTPAIASHRAAPDRGAARRQAGARTDFCMSMHFSGWTVSGDCTSMHDYQIIPPTQLVLPGVGTLHVDNREQWMTSFADWMRPYFERAGLTIPTKMRFGIGRLLGGGSAQAIGRCHPHTWSKDGTAEITVDLSQDDSTTVGATIVHEMIHAHLKCEGGHGARFRRAMSHVGLVGNATATEPGPWLRDIVDHFVEERGTFPHAAMAKNIPARRRKADAAGYLKLACPACHWAMRMTRKHLNVARPICCVPGCPKQGDELLVQGEFEPVEPVHSDEPVD